MHGGLRCCRCPFRADGRGVAYCSGRNRPWAESHWWSQWTWSVSDRYSATGRLWKRVSRRDGVTMAEATYRGTFFPMSRVGWDDAVSSKHASMKVWGCRWREGAFCVGLVHRRGRTVGEGSGFSLYLPHHTHAGPEDGRLPQMAPVPLKVHGCVERLSPGTEGPEAAHGTSRRPAVAEKRTSPSPSATTLPRSLRPAVFTASSHCSEVVVLVTGGLTDTFG